MHRDPWIAKKKFRHYRNKQLNRALEAIIWSTISNYKHPHNQNVTQRQLTTNWNTKFSMATNDMEPTQDTILHLTLYHIFLLPKYVNVLDHIQKLKHRTGKFSWNQICPPPPPLPSPPLVLLFLFLFSSFILLFLCLSFSSSKVRL